MIEFTSSEAVALNKLIDSLLRKLALAKTCGAYYKGTNKKTVDGLIIQINALYKACGINHSIKE